MSKQSRKPGKQPVKMIYRLKNSSSMEVPQKLKKKKYIPYDSAIPCLSIYLKKNTNIKRSVHPHVHAALFTSLDI